MSLKIFFLTLVLSTPALAQTKPDAAYLDQLHQNYLQVASTQPEAAQLLEQARTKAAAPSSREFLNSLSFCDEAKSNAAGVVQKSKQQYFYFTRELDEQGLEQKDAVLIKHYSERYGESLPKKNQANFVWKFEPDIVVVTEPIVSDRHVCIREGVTPLEAVELLAHELIHFIKPADQGMKDMLLYRDLSTYSQKAILEPGDEVDAYIFQFTMTIRHVGKKGLRVPKHIHQMFLDDGKFIGRRESLTYYILEDLRYRVTRFRDEFSSQVRAQLSQEETRLKIQETLLATRQNQEIDFEHLGRGRNRILNFVWPAYRKVTEDYKLLLAGAKESKSRLLANIASQRDRTEKLKKMAALY